MKSTINERMRQIREHIGLDQTGMGVSIGLKQSSYSALETTSKGISGPILKLLEILYNVNIEFLLNGKGEPFNKPKNLSQVNDSEVPYGYKASWQVSEQHRQHLEEKVVLLEKQIALYENLLNKKQKSAVKTKR